MQCPSCQAEVADSLARCCHCGASIAVEAARRFHEEAAERADAEASRDLHQTYPEHLRVRRPPVPSGPAVAPAGVVRTRPQQPPGAGYALASLICSIVGVLLLTSCFGTILSPLPLALAAVLGYLASRELPPTAERRFHSQAQFGLWIGVGGTVLALIMIGLFLIVLVIGAMGGATAA